MPGLPNKDSTVVIKYNNFIFPPAISTKFTVEPIHSDSGRAVTKLRGTLSIECILTGVDFDEASSQAYSVNNAAFADHVGAGNNLSEAQLPLMRLLTAVGKELFINNLGVMDIWINNDPQGSLIVGGKTFVAAPDLNNGPTPRVYEIMSIKDGRAVHIMWTCEFHFSPCEDRHLERERPMIDSFDFSISYNLDANGNLTRAIQGSVGLPNWVNSSSRTAINPDRTNEIKTFLVKFFPLVPAYTRTQNFTTDPTRTRVTFALTDTRIASDEPYGPGVSSCDVTHSLRNDLVQATGLAQGDDKGLSFTMNFSGTIEVMAGYSKRYAWNMLFLIIKSRLKDLETGYMMFAFSVTEHIFGRMLSVDISYKIFSDLNNLWAKSQLFKQVNPPSAWIEWNNARKEQFEPYGLEGDDLFGVNDQDDRVITICDTNYAPRPPQTSTKDSRVDPKLAPTTDIGTKTTSSSLYKYSNRCTIESSMSVAVQSYISEGDAVEVATESNSTKQALSTPTSGSNDEQAEMKGVKNGIQIARKDSVPNEVQIQGTGFHYVVMEGSAVRIGRTVVPPSVKSVGGESKSPVLIKDQITPSQLVGWTADGVPLYHAAWRRVYCLPNLGSRTIDLANIPVRYVDGQESYPTDTIV